MTLDDNCHKGQTGEMTLVDKGFDDIKVTGIESSDGLYEVTIKFGTTTLNVATGKKCRHWNDRLRHCGTELML